MDRSHDRLELNSQLTELIRVRPWVEAVVDRYGFSEEAGFSIHLCIEEALANVVLHGYGNEPGHPIVICTSVSGGNLCFAIEDKAPPFVPVEPGAKDNAAKPASLESIEPGGHGLRLLHRFAGSIAHEALSDGNRLTIGFPIPPKDASA